MWNNMLSYIILAYYRDFSILWVRISVSGTRTNLMRKKGLYTIT